MHTFMIMTFVNKPYKEKERNKNVISESWGYLILVFKS
jgi:hypothetical protein